MCYDYEWKTELRPPFSTSEPNSVNSSFDDEKQFIINRSKAHVNISAQKFTKYSTIIPHKGYI